jgi:hypothetical protein
MNSKRNKFAVFLACGILLMVLPFLLQPFGNSWVRIIDMVLLYIMLALGLNIVVGYAGLLDLGYVAFFAVGAYVFGLLASPHLLANFAGLAASFPDGVHYNIWVVLAVAALIAGLAGMLLGAPTLKLRGDYLAIVTLGFGEIVRIFLLNLDRPVNITNGPKGLMRIDDVNLFGVDFGRPLDLGFITVESVSLYYYLFLLMVIMTIFICYRIENSRIGRQGHGLEHPQFEADGFRDGRLVRWHFWGFVRRFPRVCLTGIFLTDGVHHDCRDGGSGWSGAHPWGHSGCHPVGWLARGATPCRWSAYAANRRPFSTRNFAPIADRFGDDCDHDFAAQRVVARARTRQVIGKEGLTA